MSAVITSNDENQADGGARSEERTRRESKALASLNKKLAVVRDRIRGVALGYQTGAIITGRGGISKSYTIAETLDELGVPYVRHNTHLMPRGLFNELDARPAEVHVFEDVEELLAKSVSLGILRSATWGTRSSRTGQMERMVSWATNNGSLEITFEGGVILVSNRPLNQSPELKALATRIPHVDLVVTDAEVAALMRQIAANGYDLGGKVLEPAECLEVADFIIAEASRLNRSLDVRLLINAFADRLQADDHDSDCGWRDLVASTMRGRPAVTGDVRPRGIGQKSMDRDREVAREIAHLPRNDRFRLWQERVKHVSQSTLYRRLAELGRTDAIDLGA